MTVALMMAIITVNCTTKAQEIDAIVFQNKEQCVKAIEPIKKEVMKQACMVALACVEREVYTYTESKK